MVWIMTKLGVCGINYCGTVEIQWSAHLGQQENRAQDAQKGRPARPFQVSLPFFRGVAEAALYCAHRTTVIHLNDFSKLARYLFRDGG